LRCAYRNTYRIVFFGIDPALMVTATKNF